MSDIAIFVIGFFIMLIVCGTVGLLIWAAIEDGKYNREQQQRQSEFGAPNSSDS
jgi:predicted lipid-binding transport protein (Tim44 family)